jgi:hypothetical protein
VTKFADGGARRRKTSAMDLSKAVACTALVLMIVLSAGHALADQKPAKKSTKPSPCVIKPVMTDAEIAACRSARRR